MKTTCTNFFSALSLFLCAASFFAAPSGAATPDEQEARSLRENLIKNFQALGSFEADYTGTKQGSPPMRLHLIYASQNKYVLIEIFHNNKTSEPDAAFMLDYGGAPAYTIISASERKQFQLSFSDLVENRSHPLGVLLAALQETAKACQTERFRIDFKNIAPTIEIELGPETATAGIGMSNTGLELSWAKEEQILQAEDISETESELTIADSPIHMVRIDKRTGLLLADVWTQTDRTERKLVLEKFTKVYRDKPYNDSISRFKKIATKEDLTGDVLDRFWTQFLIAVADTLNKDKDFDDYLIKHAHEIRKTSREISEKYWLRVRTAEMGPGRKPDPFVVHFIEKVLVPGYEQVVKKTGKNISFKEFMRMCREDRQMKEILLAKAGYEEDLSGREAEYDKYIAALPDESRKPLLRLLEIGKKEIQQGKTLAYIDSILYYAENFYNISKRP